ncbi:hypothetical protein B9T31_10025 [Acinetobacter sp. ANC 4558]|uniref:hypothetical protein n=1 Tax=Acinetobacter sp. ANC 4558 TaxID=1977876 RepID=UPI000A331FCA|nr:hypothetical protein [Acinetobacter sp. ANC 4558]OTG85917.1 hypothetical protein B9T31_10025 [Acinetobacter sp. ANC 4558]
MQKPSIQLYKKNIAHHNKGRGMPIASKSHHQIKVKDENYDFHIFIAILGAVIGGIIALFIVYLLRFNILSYTSFVIIPISVALLLRKIYLRTLVNIGNQADKE